MPPLYPISGKKLIKLLEKLDFVIIRVNGSHHFLHRVVDGKTVVVPIHGNEDIGRGLLRTILRDAELSVEEYEKIRFS